MMCLNVESSKRKKKLCLMLVIQNVLKRAFPCSRLCDFTITNSVRRLELEDFSVVSLVRFVRFVVIITNPLLMVPLVVLKSGWFDRFVLLKNSDGMFSNMNQLLTAVLLSRK
jgi:hypothetical protein